MCNPTRQQPTRLPPIPGILPVWLIPRPLLLLRSQSPSLIQVKTSWFPVVVHASGLDETVEPAVVGVTVEGLWHLIPGTK